MDGELSLGRRKSPLGLGRNRSSILGTIGRRGSKELSFGHKPKVQYRWEQRLAQIRQRPEGLTTQHQPGVAMNNKKGLVVFLCILSKFRLAQLNL